MADHLRRRNFKPRRLGVELPANPKQVTVPILYDEFAICLGWLASAACVVAQCSLPTTYNWTSTGALVQPKSGWASLSEFTAVPYQGKYLVYGTTYSVSLQWGSMAFNLVSNFTELATATQIPMDKPAVASTLFFFAPKNIWVLAYQWGAGTSAFARGDHWRHKNMYLFFAGNNGNIYRASMPIGKFPRSFGTSSTIVMSEGQALLFEGVQVYTIKGQKKKYLMLVEAVGRQGRYVRSFTATSLDGDWAANAVEENNPFAGKVNSGATWTNDIRQVEIIRDSANQTNTIDLCNLRALYQGKDPNASVFLPYPMRPALLTLKQPV
ncbi:alpha-L-arabinofuranosidase axhA-2 [Coprinopsis sp. MPI-PUGE-AT-0042]|nr:alpha-L-arabinofuranosidase axhA-2 [Coprinopsis sp. MPI-PUGE-AT-0042]